MLIDSGLVGRDDELETLGELVGGLPGRGGALLILGDAGAGKSSLLDAAVELAGAAGHRVLHAAGTESEADLPFGGLHQLLWPVIRMARPLPEPQHQALLSAMGLRDGPPPGAFAVALGVLNLLAGLAEDRPLVVALDDLHCLDQESQEALAFVAHRVDHDPVLIIATVRTGHASPFAATGLPEIVLRGLDAAAAGELLLAYADDLGAAGQARIVRESQGNPLTLLELADAWRARGGPGVGGVTPRPPMTARLERAFADRIAVLPPATRDAVLVAAIDYGDELPEILAAASALAGRPMTAAVLDPAARTRLLRLDGSRLRFQHPLVRSAVLGLEPLARRLAANAALAQALTGDPRRRAWHRAQAILGPDDQVADELEAGHVVSLRQGAVVAAVWALERAAQLTTDPARRGRRLLIAAGHAFTLGRAELVERLITEAARYELAEQDRVRMEWLKEIFNDGTPGDTERVVELATGAARSAGPGNPGSGRSGSGRSGSGRSGSGRSGSGNSGSGSGSGGSGSGGSGSGGSGSGGSGSGDSGSGDPGAGDPDLALGLLHGAALRCWWAEAGQRGREAVIGVAESGSLPGDDPRRIAAMALAEPVRLGAVVHDLLSAALPASALNAVALHLLGQAAHAIGDLPRAADILSRSELRLREEGRLGLLTHVLVMQAGGHLCTGDWERAGTTAEEGRRLAADTGQPLWATAATARTALLRALRGDSEPAMELAGVAEAAARREGLNQLLCCALLAKGVALLVAGAHEEAYRELRRPYDPADPGHHPRESFGGVLFLAEAALRSGREQHITEARKVLAGLERTALVTPAPLLHTQLLYARAVLAPDDKAETLYASALRQDLSRWPFVRAKLELAYGGWLRGRRRSAEARMPLRSARTAFDLIGARTWADQARADLRSAGERAAEPSPAALSPQELQIARLAADGLSNREIGERLHLSPRTIGSHLYRIFPKLGITTRTQLASCLERPDDDPRAR
ncbi:LuxR family transcriptional regulator [Nonomuraea sp. NPDC050404]|uniref:helix-turn-helix transcriptional regulator n=1 Tax=Nonomuraea sp. NPDC050404 TaxID=3155783 RepID=UPI0033FDA72C